MIPDAIREKVVIYSGLNALRRHLNRKPRVLFWHGIDTRVDKELCPENFSVDIFKKQIQYLRKHYDIISIKEFDRRLAEDSFTGREMLLTFDDGYASNLYVVEPILSQFNLPFTVFISTDNITTGDFYPTSVCRLVTRAAGLDKLALPTIGQEFNMPTDADRAATCKVITKMLKTRPLDEVKAIVGDLLSNISPDEWENLKNRFECIRPMNWEEVLKLSRKENVTIGSHCMWHIICHEQQKPEEVKHQLTGSKQIIEDRLQLPCDYFAYPNGNYTEFSNDCVKSAYRLGFGADQKTEVCKEQSFELPRILAYLELGVFKRLINT